MQIANAQVFAWLNHFLRDQAVIAAGIEHPQLAYLRKPPADVIDRQVARSDFMVADADHDKCYGPPVWRHSNLRLYRTAGGISAVVAAIATGPDRITVSVHALREGVAEIGFDLLRFGQAAVNSPTISLRSAVEERTVTADGNRLEAMLRVPAGHSSIDVAGPSRSRPAITALSICLR